MWKFARLFEGVLRIVIPEEWSEPYRPFLFTFCAHRLCRMEGLVPRTRLPGVASFLKPGREKSRPSKFACRDGSERSDMLAINRCSIQCRRGGSSILSMFERQTSGTLHEIWRRWRCGQLTLNAHRIRDTALALAIGEKQPAIICYHPSSYPYTIIKSLANNAVHRRYLSDRCYRYQDLEEPKLRFKGLHVAECS